MFVKKRAENCRIGLDSHSHTESSAWPDMLHQAKRCGDLSIKAA